jgi:DNA-binding IclR family transcriptional regulator
MSKLTTQRLAVLAAIEQRGGRAYVNDLADETGIKSGMYRLLAQLEGEGVVGSDWEDAQIPGRPRRRVYFLANQAGTG